MAYLIGEVLAFLAAAALIGAGMAWMLQSLRSSARERRLNAEIQEARSGRDAAEAAARTLAAMLNDLRTEMERETGRLKARVAELEARQQAVRAPAAAPGRLKEAVRTCGRFLIRVIARLAHFISSAARRLLH
jgi:uncharacterized protein HemX